MINTTTPLPPVFESYDAHISGKIILMSPPIDGWVTVALQNECRASMAQRVAVMVPDAPGVTYEPNERASKNRQAGGRGDEDLIPRTCLRPPVCGARCGGDRCILEMTRMGWSLYGAGAENEED